jgi:hypothetical protein
MLNYQRVAVGIEMLMVNTKYALPGMMIFIAVR